MQRFRVKQWREIFEEVIVEAVDLAEAEQLADGYPDYIDAPVEVVKEVEGRYRHITPACVERAINRAKRLTGGKGEIYYEASAVKQAIADGINKTPMTHHQAIIMNQLRQPGKCLFSVILDTQPVGRVSDET